MDETTGAGRGQNAPRERPAHDTPENTAPSRREYALGQTLEDPPRLPRPLSDALLFIIVGTAATLTVGLGLLAALWGRGEIVGELPLFVPAISSFTALAAASVAFLALGRYLVLHEPSAYWAGLAFGALSILYVVYVLTWPDVGPGQGGILATLPNTSTWIFDLAIATTGVLLLAATVLRWPDPRHQLVPQSLAVACMIAVTLIGTLSVVFEDALPSLVVDGRYTTATQAVTAALTLLYGIGAILSVLRYRRTGDTLLGHVALFQVVVAFGVVAFSASQQRYDPWWYLSRILVAGVLTAVLFGLLGEYVGLYRRERERTWALDQQRALLHAVIEQMPAGVVIAEVLSGRALVINHRMAQLFRRADLPTNALEDHPGRQGFRPDGRPYGWDEWPLARTIRHGEVVRDEEIVIVRGDGTHGVISVNGAPVRDWDGRIVAGVIVDLDITERKAVEEALRESERQLRELNEALENRVAERTRQLRALAAELTMAEERERRRLAQVLHDDLQQVLAAATYHLERLRLQPPHEEDGAGLKEPIAMLRAAILTSRTLIAQLSPTILYEMGLVPALNLLGRQMEEQHGLLVTIVAEECLDAQSIPEDIGVFLYQTARELLINVAKHAGTGGANLHLTRAGLDAIQMTVSDTGHGFDSSLATRHHGGAGYGLFGISERLQHIGGSMHIDSAPGHGTTIIVSVPVHAPTN